MCPFQIKKKANSKIVFYINDNLITILKTSDGMMILLTGGLKYCVDCHTYI